MINITGQCTARLEVIGNSAIIYIHLGKNDGETRDGAIGFFKQDGFHPMSETEGKVTVVEDEYGWFRIEIDSECYLELMGKARA